MAMESKAQETGSEQGFPRGGQQPGPQLWQSHRQDSQQDGIGRCLLVGDVVYEGKVDSGGIEHHVGDVPRSRLARDQQTHLLELMLTAV